MEHAYQRAIARLLAGVRLNHRLLPKIIFTSILFLMALAATAQYEYQGQIIDADTQVGLVGATIAVPETQLGATTDNSGRFVLKSDRPVTEVVASYLGYAPVKINLAANNNRISLATSKVDLNQVIISGSRAEQARKDAPIAVSQLSPQVIRETNATQLEQLLNKISGVNMVDLGNEQHSMSIRQPISTKSVFLYLEDGIPIRPTGLFNHNALIETNMANFNSVEVIRGPASSVYGSEAIGGAINFISLAPSLLPTGRVAVQGNNLGYRRVDVRAGGTTGKLGVSVGGYYAQRRDGYRQYSDFDKLALTLRGDYTFSPKLKLESSVSVIDYKTDATVSVDSAQFFGRKFSSVHSFAYRIVKAVRARTTLSNQWNEQNKTTVTAFFRDNFIGQNATHTLKNSKTNPLAASSEISNVGFQSYGLIAQHQKSFNFWNANLIGGLSLDYSPAAIELRYIDVTRGETGNYLSFTDPDSLLSDQEVGLMNTGIYSQFSVSPVKNLNLVAALRYDRFVYNYNNFLDAKAFSGAPDSRNEFGSFSPKLGLTYDFSRNRGLYANYARGFVPPQVSELYRGVKVPTLKPTYFNNYEMGGWFSFAGKGYVDVSVYQLNGRNELINFQLEDGSVEQRSAGRTSHAGVEYTFQYAPAKVVSVRLSGSNAQHKFVRFSERADLYDNNEMPGAPNWIANAEITYKPTFLKNARIGAEWQHIGAYYLDALNSEKYPGFDIFNVRLGYTLKNFETWVNILNVGDELYSVNASKRGTIKRYSFGDPRSVNLGLAYNLRGK